MDRAGREWRPGEAVAALVAVVLLIAPIAHACADSVERASGDDGSRVIAAAPPSGIGPIGSAGETDPPHAADGRSESVGEPDVPVARASGSADTGDSEDAAALSIGRWILPAIGAVVFAWWIRRRSWRLPAHGDTPVDDATAPTARWPIDPPMLAAAIAALMLGSVVGTIAALDVTNLEPGTIAFTGAAMLGGSIVDCALATAILLIVLSMRARAAGESIGAFVAAGVRPGLRIGVLAALGGIPVVFAAGTFASLAVALLGFQPPEDAPAHDTLRQLVEQDVGAWSIVIAVLVTTAVPFAEETLYRGLIPEALRRFGLTPTWVIVASAAVFAVAHIGALDAASLVPALTMLLVLGLILGWCAERTRGLLAPIVVHALFNAANLVIASA